MFARACDEIRECIYGLVGLSQVAPNHFKASNATGFMIAPGIVVTAGHFCRVDGDPTNRIHGYFEAIRSPDIGEEMEPAALIAFDLERDLALFKLGNPRSTSSVELACDVVPTGTSCGSLGFPLASVVFSPEGRTFNIIERFQGASISAYRYAQSPNETSVPVYETDSPMYSGSSGCPGFLADARVFGMHTSSLREPVSSRAAFAGPGPRLSISLWVPAADIREFARAQGINV